jgi:large subunit ribosomal protein L15
MTMRLNNLQPRPGAKHRTKRLGCGDRSGHGKTSGRGGKGQTARAGGSIRLGFEGGQMPLLRRIPKRGFNNKEYHTGYATVNVGDLNAAFANGATVTPAALVEQGLLKKLLDGVKILGDGDLAKKLTVQAQAFSASAREKITRAGGVCEELPMAGIHHQAAVPAVPPAKPAKTESP